MTVKKIFAIIFSIYLHPKYLLILQDQLENIKIGRVLLQKQIKGRYVLPKQLLLKERQEASKGINRNYLLLLDQLKALKMK